MAHTFTETELEFAEKFGFIPQEGETYEVFHAAGEPTDSFDCAQFIGAITVTMFFYQGVWYFICQNDTSDDPMETGELVLESGFGDL
jgi:hypothetical protein